MTLNYDEKKKNIILGCIVAGMCLMAGNLSASIQNITFADSSDLDLKVGYWSEIVKYIAQVLVAFVFHAVKDFSGIKITAATSTLFMTGNYWTMIWIVNEHVIYLGAFLAGIGWGVFWIIWPMVLMDNSNVSNSQQNMGYWWVVGSLGVVVGSLCNFIYFKDLTEITKTNRVMVYSIFTAITVLAAVIAGFGISDVRKRKDGYSQELSMTDLNPPDTKKAIDWFKAMVKLPKFWILHIPLIYWAFMWGYFIKILPTATASISDKRSLIPLITLIMGASFLVGSTCWNFVVKYTNNTFCVATACVMELSALTISVLVFPKGAAAEILDIETIETYIKPGPIYVVVIAVLIGLADSAISIIYFSIAGRIYGVDGTSLGYSVNSVGFCVCYITSMFAPLLFDLHSYCYSTMGAVVLMGLSLTVGLREYM